jgi:hypothetical protein
VDEEGRDRLNAALLEPIQGVEVSESAERKRRENEMALFHRGAAAVAGG